MVEIRQSVPEVQRRECFFFLLGWGVVSKNVVEEVTSEVYLER